jgi:hypothetical protein
LVKKSRPPKKKIKIEIHSFITLSTKIANTLVNEVFISKSFDPNKASRFPNPNIYKAIWDTGATNSVITEKVITECDLKPIGITKVFTPSGESRSEAFLVNIMLPNKVGISNLRVTKGQLVGNADVLIGMDIINRGDLLITNENVETRFSFLVPSTGKIDLNLHKKPIQSFSKEQPKPNVGRNDPCPCGSGLKYKKCCGRPT